MKTVAEKQMKHNRNIIWLLALVATAVILSMPLNASAQQDDDDFEEYEDPEQPKIDSLLNLIKPDSPDSIKANI